MSQVIRRNEPLTHPWPGTDPFLFCARHEDHYPSSDDNQGVPDDQIGARPLGNDFSGIGGFSMYYGERVPGFPAHPHRGFETVTIVSSGIVDHSDSLGATARYGDGDVQWLTAGRGVMHAEMFPLRDNSGENLLDLYQIWLNLPPASKMVDPAFVMLWDGTIPRYQTRGENGAVATVKVIAGSYAPQEGSESTIVPPPAAPDSWASNPEAELAIWQITLDVGASLTLPAALQAGVLRTLYIERGDQLEIAGETVSGNRLIEVEAQVLLTLSNTGSETALLTLLQAVPIGAPVAAAGPFVMNTQDEIQQARYDFGRTQFGGWPWSERGPVHKPGEQRFARYPGQEALDVPPPSTSSIAE